MANFPQDVGPGLFVPTTEIFDLSSLEGKSLDSTEFRQFIVVLTQRINDISSQLNLKDTGIYAEEGSINNQVYFPNPTSTTEEPIQRSVLRKVVNFVDGTVVTSLPNTGSTSVAHGITVDANTSFTRIYGAATDQSNSFIPLPYASPTLADNIELEVDTTDVIITTGSDRTGYTLCYVVLEFITS